MYLKDLLILGGGCILEFPVTMKSERNEKQELDEVL